MRARYRLFVHPIETIRGLWCHYMAVAYDHWHGIETGRQGVDVRYDATEPKYIRWAFRNLPIDPSEYSFVDIGSGKGRVLIAAAGYPFLQVVGIEYAKELHETALNNIRSAKRIKCRNVTSLCMHAIQFSIPDTPCVIFLYQPFNRETMERVLSNIHASRLSSPPALILCICKPTPP